MQWPCPHGHNICDNGAMARGGLCKRPHLDSDGHARSVACPLHDDTEEPTPQRLCCVDGVALRKHWPRMARQRGRKRPKPRGARRRRLCCKHNRGLPVDQTGPAEPTQVSDLPFGGP
eukprot:365126-Chlamydomonas_euryale.AAC.39